MFEKEAEEYCGNLDESKTRDFIKDAFKDGAEFGYNKAKEWHYTKDGDLPKQLVDCLVYGKEIGIDEDNTLMFSYLYRGKWQRGIGKTVEVIAWKEIVLPKEIE